MFCTPEAQCAWQTTCAAAMMACSVGSRDSSAVAVVVSSGPALLTTQHFQPVLGIAMPWAQTLCIVRSHGRVRLVHLVAWSSPLGQVNKFGEAW